MTAALTLTDHQADPTPPTTTTPPSGPAAGPLKAALARAGRVAPARSSNPLLTRIQLTGDATTESLTLRATSLDLEIAETITAPGISTFEGFAPSAMLARVAGVMGKGGSVGVSYEDGDIALALPDLNLTYRFPSGEDSPPLKLPEVQSKRLPAAARLTAGELAAALRLVRYAVSNEAFQAVFRSILVTTVDGRGVVVATDGYRIAQVTLSTPVPSMLIPGFLLSNLAAYLGSRPPESEVELAALEHNVSKDHNGKLYATKARLTGDNFAALIDCTDGDFPDYRRVIPTRGPTTEWAKTPLLRRLRGLAVTADRNTNNRITLVQRGAGLTLETEGDYGRAMTGLDLDAPLSGSVSEIHTAINLNYLMDAVQNAPEERIKVMFGESRGSPVLLLSSGVYQAVVVSLRN